MKIIMDARQRLQLVGTLQLIDVTDIKQFDEYESEIKKNYNEEDENQIKRRNIETRIRRVEACEISRCGQSAES